MDSDIYSMATARAPSAATLTRPQKAAAILVAMGKPAAGRLLKFFKHEELKALIEGARMLRTIPQGELEKIIEEFEEEFTEGAGLMDSAATMDTILSESLSPEEVAAIMNHGDASASGDVAPTIWPSVERLEPEKIGQFLAGEHPQTGALLLTSVSPQVAAAILLTLEKPLRGEVVKRMLTIGSVKPAAMRIIEDQIRSRLLGENAGKSAAVGQTRVANVLNEMEKSQLDEVLGDLQTAGASNIQAIRARLFSFEDVVLLSQKARNTLFDGLSTEIVTLALRGATRDLTEAVLGSIGVRSRRMIEAELGMDGGNVPLVEIGRARRIIASTAIRLANEGALELPVAQDAA